MRGKNAYIKVRNLCRFLTFKFLLIKPGSILEQYSLWFLSWSGTF